MACFGSTQTLRLQAPQCYEIQHYYGFLEKALWRHAYQTMGSELWATGLTLTSGSSHPSGW